MVHISWVESWVGFDRVVSWHSRLGRDGMITNEIVCKRPRSWSFNSSSTLIPLVNINKLTVEHIKQNPASQLPFELRNSCRSEASYSAGAFWSLVQHANAQANL